jgi:hypothetical protein
VGFLARPLPWERILIRLRWPGGGHFVRKGATILSKHPICAIGGCSVSVHFCTLLKNLITDKLLADMFKIEQTRASIPITLRPVRYQNVRTGEGGIE